MHTTIMVMGIVSYRVKKVSINQKVSFSLRGQHTTGTLVLHFLLTL